MTSRRRDAFQTTRSGIDMWIYSGNDDLEQVRITAPAWEAECEETIIQVDL